MFKSLINTSYPFICSRLLNVLLDVISVFIVAHLGISILSAYGIVMPIYLTIFLIITSYLLIFSVKAARISQNKNIMSIYIGSGLVFSLILSIINIIIFIAIPKILPYLGQSISVSHYAGNFFYLITLGVPAILMNIIITQTLVVYSKSAFVLWSAIIQVCVGIFFVLLFTHYFKLNLKGVALGFDISYWAKFFILMTYLKNSKDIEFKCKLGSKPQITEDIKFLVKLGWPVSLQYGGELLAGSIAALMIGHIYSEALAAQQLANQVRVLCIMIPYGLSQGLSIMLSAKHSGDLAERRAYTHLFLKESLFWTIPIMLAIVLVINSFSLNYAINFLNTNNQHLIYLTQIFIVITSVAVLFDTIKYLLMGLLRGMSDTKGSMFHSLGAYYIIGIPSAYLMGYVLHLGAIGIRLGMLFGLLVSVILIFKYYLNFVNCKYTRESYH